MRPWETLDRPPRPHNPRSVVSSPSRPSQDRTHCANPQARDCRIAQENTQTHGPEHAALINLSPPCTRNAKASALTHTLVYSQMIGCPESPSLDTQLHLNAVRGMNNDAAESAQLAFGEDAVSHEPPPSTTANTFASVCRTQRRPDLPELKTGVYSSVCVCVGGFNHCSRSIEAINSSERATWTRTGPIVNALLLFHYAPSRSSGDASGSLSDRDLEALASSSFAPFCRISPEPSCDHSHSRTSFLLHLKGELLCRG